MQDILEFWAIRELCTGTSFPETKYYDFYTTTDSLTACNGGVCIGQALHEVDYWYNTYSSMVIPSSPWISRGSSYSSNKSYGLVQYSSINGAGSWDLSYRLVMSLK